MQKFAAAIQKFLRDEEGVTAIEYGLIAAVLAVGVTLAFNTLSGSINDLFTRIGEQLNPAP